ncbi:MAG: TRIC cation channel family protein [Methylobacterium sp.]|nr:TRIC cation channel family protein [Methylobacterium sp.]
MRGGPEWFLWIETLGILSFAINAMIVAKGKNLSTFGFFLCAVATALGGGTLRDILLGPQAQPFFWVAFPFYIVAIFVLSIAYANVGFLQAAIAKRDFVIKETAEAVALASLGGLGAAKTFILLGPQVAPTALGQMQLWILCAFFGAMSAAFGSILRDIIINEFPGALRPGVWVIEALFLGCGLLALLRMLGVSAPWALLAGFLVTLLIRLWIVAASRRAQPA